MTALLTSIHKFENKFDRRAEHFVLCHPHLAFFAMFVGMPLFILAAVAACTTVITLPLALIFGWL